MRAAVLDEKNGPFRIEQREPPPLEPGTVLLRVRACGVCHRDIIDRRGLYPFSTFPRVLGHEIAGEILEVGPGAPIFAWATASRRHTGLRAVSASRACPTKRSGASGASGRTE